MTETYLARAIELALQHSLRGEGGPFGCVIVRDGTVVAEGWNQVLTTLDPTSHAEIVAIRRATAALRSRTLTGCVLYTSCEPCPMCFAAAHWARIDAIHFAATREDAAAIGFDDAKLYDELALPPGGREMPCFAHARDSALEAMRTWSESPARIVY